MQHRRHSWLVCLFLTIMLTSCYLRPSTSSVESSTARFIQSRTVSPENMVYLSFADTTYSYDFGFEYWDILSEQGKMFYDAMWNFKFKPREAYQSNLYHYSPANTFDLAAYLEAQKLLYLDHPEKELESLWNMSFSFYSGEEDYCNWGLCSLIEEKEYVSMMTRINLEISNLVYKVKKEPIKREKYQLIHDWIIANVKYDYEYYQNCLSPETKQFLNPESANIYGAIVNKLAVCDGISDAFKYICNQCHLECISVGGYFPNPNLDDSISLGHQWNLVYDQKWYLVDCTFDLDSDPSLKYFMADMHIDNRISNYPLEDYLKKDS